MIRFNYPGDGALLTPAFNPAVDVSIARADAAGKLLGGTTYEKFTGTSVFMHVRSFDPHWFSKDLLWVVFHYPFVQLGCKVVGGLTYSTNNKAVAFNKRIGFKIEHIIKDACPAGDLILFTMRREDCRWLDIRPTGLKVTSKGNP